MAKGSCFVISFVGKLSRSFTLPHMHRKTNGDIEMAETAWKCIQAIETEVNAYKAIEKTHRSTGAPGHRSHFGK